MSGSLDARPSLASTRTDRHLCGYDGQVKYGHLDKTCQPKRYPGDRRCSWATRGYLGLSAASHWEYLPKCYQPEILDTPVISAIVGFRKWKRRCEGRKAISWCP